MTMPQSPPIAFPGRPAVTGGRRGLLQAGALAAVSSLAPAVLLGGCAGPAPPGAASSGRPMPPDSAAATDYRLANRIAFGATDAELERVRAWGAAGYLQRQLRADLGPLPPAAQAQIDALHIVQRPMPDLAMEIEGRRKAGEALATEDARKAAQNDYQQALNRLSREAAHRDLLRALYSPNQLREQMQWFWFNHFNVHQYKSNIRAMLGDYQEHAIRPHALGRFRDLLGAVTRHPAMLRYLDNEQNAAGRINENLGRELLELHTLGVDGGYTQRDVQEMARVLTGHGVNLSGNAPRLKPEQAALLRRDGLYEFNPVRHDFNEKTVLGLKLSGKAGAAELDEVLDRLAAHPATARFVSRKIACHLLADEPPEAVVAAMADTWVRQDGRMADVLGVLLRAPEFTAPGPGKFKDPVHWVVSAVRACYGERVVLATAPMQGWLARLGEGLYNRQTPDGYPDTQAAWSSSGQLAARLDIARALGSGSAGLFRADDGGAPAAAPAMAAALAAASAAAMPTAVAAVREQPAFPLLARPLYWQVLRPAMGAATRAALDGAGSPQDWNTLYLSAPEFMYG